MITSLLIANRGEIARRILRTCRAMGIRGVVVYSDADADTPAVREADLALRVGPSPAALSYLDGETILALAQGNGCEAIHPGYGFLSENAAFSQACAERGLIFVGAPPEAIRLLGDKAEAKRIAEQAGSPVLMGWSGEDQSAQNLGREAKRIGFPVLVKALAGGGGRGIRIVQQPGELEEALASARREADGAFGDGRLILEKYLEAPRHIEYQIMADRHGRVLHLFERECSVQRRHQKLIEEAPSPALTTPLTTPLTTAALREAMGAAAVQVARAAHYEGAGTVEFLLDGEGRFYFLEMNTRLQVEHPVTELTLGLDLVRLQIEIAEGRPLALAQADLRPRGHAIELRLNAEDPSLEFIPTTGRLGCFEFPEGPGLRVDAGFEPGAEISSFYDSLLAKLIVWGETREEALRRARHLLAGSFVTGIATNQSYLQWVLDRPEFAEGGYTTRLVEQGAADWAATQAAPLGSEWLWAAAAVDLIHAAAPSSGASTQAGSPWEAAVTWQAGATGLGELRRSYRLGTERHEVVATTQPGGRIRVSADGVPQEVHLIVSAPGRGMLDLGVARLPLRWDARGPERWLLLRGRPIRYRVEAPGELTAGVDRDEAQHLLRSPLPGKVIRLAVRAGERVEKGQLLAVVEAMKMEHRITAPYSGQVAALHFAEGDRCGKDDLLLELEPEGGV
jgi:3-methylcrotonyl-CoA carboxylase alpha subunit